MNFVSKAISVGGSIMVTIPKQVVETLQIQSNERVVLEVQKIKKSGFGLYRGIGKFTKEDELTLDV